MLLTAKRAGIGLLATWTAAALDTRDMSGRTDLAEVVRTLIDGRGDIAQSRRAAESARQFQRAAALAGSSRPASISDADIARSLARSEDRSLRQRCVISFVFPVVHVQYKTQ